jgi:hypothetical protein
LFLAKQIQIYIKDLDFAAYDDNGKSKSTRWNYIHPDCSLNQSKNKAERFVRKRKTNGDVGLSIGGKLLFGYDNSKLENKRIHLWLMMNKQPLLEQYLTGILTV